MAVPNTVTWSESYRVTLELASAVPVIFKLEEFFSDIVAGGGTAIVGGIQVQSHLVRWVNSDPSCRVTVSGTATATIGDPRLEGIGSDKVVVVLQLEEPCGVAGGIAPARAVVVGHLDLLT